MKKRFLWGVLASVFLLCTSACNTTGNHAESGKSEVSGSLFLGSKSPYPVPTNLVYTEAPAGYEASFLYVLHRHGSRNLSGFKYDKAWLELLDAARKDGQLTEAGTMLYGEIKQIADYEIGKYGLLTNLGKDELFGIGKRAGENFSDLFCTGSPLFADATYKERTQESRDSFLAGLVASGYHGEIDKTFYEKKKDPYLRPMDLAKKYSDYFDNGLWHETIKKYQNCDAVRLMAERVCSQFFGTRFLRKLDRGEMEFYDEKGKVIIDSTATASSALYELYIILPALREDGFADINLKKYFQDDELQMFETIQNAKSFYTYGSGDPASENISLNIMAPLAKHMINAIDESLDGSSPYLAVCSFAHAETLVPLVGFLDIENAGKAYDSVEEAVKNWNTAYYGPMGGNLQLVVYRSPGKEALIKVLLNERESRFSEEISPSQGPYYRWSEIRQYYLKKVEALGIVPNSSVEDDIFNLKNNF
ncbi:histidine-type phosphatase [Sediminispirochaeta bajacaliforniensis]|uniref:histidine-type phosphatase n=1 Tax=Sediminispirochaeta bajacaliforniensis TaxID=148 RepID=UPI000374E7E8|nr:histidine-type phosphatase [Sediminispirochaeta bajacaliforniensis]